MVRQIKTKWEWMADTIDIVIRDSLDRVNLKKVALTIEKNMALSYPHAPTNKLWERVYPQLQVDDHEALVQRFMYVAMSGAFTCIACTILEGVEDVPDRLYVEENETIEIFP